MKPGLMKRRQPGMTDDRMEEMQEPVDNPQEEAAEGLMRRPGQPARQPQTGGEAEQVQKLLKPAVEALYGENFDSMIQMFKANGIERFGQSMSTAINAVLQQLEQSSKMSPEIAAGVGMKLFFMLLEDIVTGGVLPKLQIQTIQQALGETIKTYAETHPDTVTEQDMQQFIQQLAQAERQELAA
jgi:hypothetical protein